MSVHSIYSPPLGLYSPDVIRTNNGKFVNVFEPTADMICIEDIAHSLAHQCRFGGHLPVFYSVAQHSIMCAMHCANDQDRFAALMHDASEAYLLDMPSPIKARLPEYKSIEDTLMRTIAYKFDFPYPLPEAVKQVDRSMLEYEYNGLMMGRMSAYIQVLDIEQARTKFLLMFNDLKK